MSLSPNYRWPWLRARVAFLPTLLWNVLLGRIWRTRNWWDAVSSQVYLGALPFARDVPLLAKLGITAVINLCEEYRGPVAAYRQHGIQQFRFPTIDFTHPSTETVASAVQEIRRIVESGGKVYVHCKAGRGRSATVVACWLVANGMTLEQAQATLLARRPHVNPHIYRRPVVVQFARRFQATDQ